jgi:hypothetical protein
MGLGTFFGNLDTALGIAGACGLFDAAIGREQRRAIGYRLASLLKREQTAERKGVLETSGWIIARVMPNRMAAIRGAVLMWAALGLVLLGFSVILSATYADSLFDRLSSGSGTLSLIFDLVLSLIATILSVLLMRELLPLFASPTSVLGVTAILMSIVGTTMFSHTLVSALLRTPTAIYLNTEQPSITPLRITVRVPAKVASQGSERGTTDPEIIVERLISERERQLLQRLMIRSSVDIDPAAAEYGPGVLHHRFFTSTEISDAFKSDQFYDKLVFKMPRAEICVRTAYELVQVALQIDGRAVRVAGRDDKTLECSSSQPVEIISLGNLLFLPDVAARELWTPFYFSLNSKSIGSIENYQTHAVRFIHGLEIGKVLPDKGLEHSRASYLRLKRLFDRRQFEAALAIQLSVPRITGHHLAIAPGFIVVILLSVAGAAVWGRLRPFRGDEWVYKRLLEAPLSVLGACFAAVSFVLVLALEFLG